MLATATPAVGDLYVKGEKTTLTVLQSDTQGWDRGTKESPRCSSFIRMERNSKSAVAVSLSLLLIGKDGKESLRLVALLHSCPHTHPLRTSTEQDPTVTMGLPPNLLLAKKKIRGAESHQSRTKGF